MQALVQNNMQKMVVMQRKIAKIHDIMVVQVKILPYIRIVFTCYTLFYADLRTIYAVMFVLIIMITCISSLLIKRNPCL